MSESLSDEELAYFRACLYDAEAGDPVANLKSDWAAVRHNAEVKLAARKLLAEVDRLRAENAAMRPIVEAIVEAIADPNGERVAQRLWDIHEQARGLLAKES